MPLPTLNVLDTISIPTHCTVPWDEMEGNDRSRLCARCQHQVHDVSELTADEALALLRGPGEPPCLRIYRRTDGRVLTAECMKRRERVWKWLSRRSTWAAAVFALLFLSGCRTATQGMMQTDYVEATKIKLESSEKPTPPAP
jgi:hypothetical protein